MSFGKPPFPVWATQRQDVATWSTPLIAVSQTRTQIIANGWKQIAGYDFATGKEFWHLKGGGDIPVASPVLARDQVILTSGHGSFRPMRAVRLDAVGDITPPQMGATNAAVLWCHPRQGNYIQTPIVVGDLLWGCSNDGVVTCFDVNMGRIQYTRNIGGAGQGFSASPVAANDKIFFTGELGQVFILRATSEFQTIATNRLGAYCLATPALAAGKIYFRTVENVLAIGSPR